jgi:hypothetical protein
MLLSCLSFIKKENLRPFFQLALGMSKLWQAFKKICQIRSNPFILLLLERWQSGRMRWFAKPVRN